MAAAAPVPFTSRALRAVVAAVNAMCATEPDGDFTDTDQENGEVARSWFKSLPSRLCIVVLTPAESHAVGFALNNALRDAEENRIGDASMSAHARVLRRAVDKVRQAPIIDWSRR